MRKICQFVVWAFGLLWLVAIGLLVIGTFGLFGQTADPLSGVFLMPLGMPWNMFGQSLPEALLPWLAVLAPGINLFLLRWVCRILAR